MYTDFFELCAESLEAAVAGELGGADRIELCSNLARGGVTPDITLTTAVLRAVSIPVHILIRPRPGSFVYSESEFELMCREVNQAKQAGASGVALGVLLADGTVDLKRTRELIDRAHPMDVTFHRAFDETPDLSEALESVIAIGADSLLTSGGAADVLSGADSIAALKQQAGDRIQLIAGGGLRLESLTEIVRRSSVFSLHGSFTRNNGHRMSDDRVAALEADVRQAVQLLQSEFLNRKATMPAR
jgi:copper homeostasis protein